MGFITDGSRDGGIDSIFFFVDSLFISDEMEDTIVIRKSAVFRLVITPTFPRLMRLPLLYWQM
jgi:hypothetical protein